jgi:hypothetical protein
VVIRRLEKVLSCDRFGAAATRVAERYRDFDPAQQRAVMLRRLDALLG